MGLIRSNRNRRTDRKKRIEHKEKMEDSEGDRSKGVALEQCRCLFAECGLISRHYSVLCRHRWSSSSISSLFYCKMVREACALGLKMLQTSCFSYIICKNKKSCSVWISQNIGRAPQWSLIKKKNQQPLLNQWVTKLDSVAWESSDSSLLHFILYPTSFTHFPIISVMLRNHCFVFQMWRLNGIY